MAEQSFPFENIDTTESQFSEWATNFQETGVQGSPTGTELGITVTGSDLNLTIAAGQAFIRGHYYINTSDLVIAVPTAGVNTRIDIVVVELNPETNTIVTKLVQGEAVSADPVAPTLTQSATGIYQLPIATLTIPASTVVITSGMLADTRTFMGNRVGIWTTATRPANPTAYQTLGYNTTIEAHESWNGTAWVGFFDPISTEGDLVVGDATGQASRLGVGTDDQVLSVVAGEVAWADAGAAGITYQLLPGTISTFSWPFDSAKTYGYFYYGAGLTIRVYDSSDNLLSTLPSGASVQYVLEQPENAAKMVMSSTSDLSAQVYFAEIVGESPSSSSRVMFIDTTKSITIDGSYTAYLIGGGGNGGEGEGEYAQVGSRGGGGGGSGYVESGTLVAGTYTATIGSSGGTTSIGSLTANGGTNGEDGVLNSTGAGGAGGSGGGGGSESSTNALGGANGTTGTDSSSPGGAGSGDSLVSTFITELLGYGPADTIGSEPAGFYKAGKGGGSAYTAVTGASATNYGGGGDGGTGQNARYDSDSGPGGLGFQGLIVLVEVA
jgi:hypothetical protein